MLKTHISRYAQLAMLLEVSATPKPGNIDREHDYQDTSYEHFLASAVGSYPVFEKAIGKNKGIGSLIHQGVTESIKWQKGGNTHFGAFILLIPLIMASGSLKDLKSQTHKIVKNSSIEDAVEFYKAFSKAKVKVKKVDELDLSDSESIQKIKQKGLTLFNLMEISASYDMIAYEWVNGFEKSFECSELINEKIKNFRINDAIVLTFIELLSKYNDTFIQTKFDLKTSQEVSKKAKEILLIKEFSEIKPKIQAFDEELLKKGINPGSCADIIIAGLFISLFKGLKF